MAVKRRNKSVYISVYSYTIPAFEPKNPVFPGIFVSNIKIYYKDFNDNINKVLDGKYFKLQPEFNYIFANMYTPK